MAQFAILLFSLLLIHHHHGVTSDVPHYQKEALLLFMQKVKHKRKYSWNASHPVCDWETGVSWNGVICVGMNSVTHLRIPGASLIGEIPPGTIGKLKNLRVLSLHDNGLYGSLPQDFSNLDKLTQLYLHKNKISGQLPDLKWEYLIKLDVSSNKFTGSIPTLLSKFNKSAFAGNIDLCGDPLRPYKDGTVCPPPQPQESQADVTNDKSKTKKEKGLIVGFSIGSALILLTFLCCLRKRITKQSKQTSDAPVQDLESASKSTSTEGDQRNELVFSSSGIYSFDLKDLCQASSEVLGKGSFGRSIKAVMDGRKTVVVVKRLEKVVVTNNEFESRMEVLGKMENQHLIPLIAYYHYSKDEKWLVYDYMPAGSLFDHLHNGSKGSGQTRLDWEHRIRIALSAARGVEYLHVDEKVVHGNIKSSNILLPQETNKDATVSDYGLSTLFDWLSSQNHRVMVYQAPEVLKTREVTFESDVYSFGILLLELLTGKDPNQASLDEEGTEFPMWVQSITNGESNAEVFDVELRRHQNIEKMVHLLQIAKKCVLFEPDQRPTMDKVVRMMEDVNRVEIDDLLIQSSDDRSKTFDDTPSTETGDTPSTITP